MNLPDWLLLTSILPNKPTRSTRVLMLAVLLLAGLAYIVVMAFNVRE